MKPQGLFFLVVLVFSCISLIINPSPIQAEGFSVCSHEFANKITRATYDHDIDIIRILINGETWVIVYIDNEIIDVYPDD